MQGAGQSRHDSAPASRKSERRPPQPSGSRRAHSSHSPARLSIHPDPANPTGTCHRTTTTDCPRVPSGVTSRRVFLGPGQGRQADDDDVVDEPAVLGGLKVAADRQNELECPLRLIRWARGGTNGPCA